MINLIKENLYRVWYNPYLLEPDEEDFMEVNAETEEEARRRVSSCGYITSVEEIDRKIDPYDESKTRTYTLPEVPKEGVDQLSKYLDRWVGEVEDYSWRRVNGDIGEVDIVCDSFVFNHIFNWAKRHGLTITRKRFDDIVNFFEARQRKNRRFIKEQDVEIEVKHEGILEVPEGKNVDDLPVSHFVNLAKKKGLSKITKALNNLQVWNKKKNPSLAKWAGDMIDKVSKKMEKNESLRGLY